MSIEVVSGSVSTVTGLGKDEAWLRNWLKDEPARLGLGELKASDDASDDDRSFVATDDARCFSVDVQLGEMDASRGFGVLENWARSRALHPDKTHVAVLVTESLSDRFETTLRALSEHLPLVVVELQAWKGQNEAIVVPHVALSSDDVDLSDTPAAKSAEAIAKTATVEATAEETTDESAAETADEASETVSESEAIEAEAAADAESMDEPASKDDTGVGNPWGLDDSSDDGSYSGGGSSGLLTKVGR